MIATTRAASHPSRRMMSRAVSMISPPQLGVVLGLEPVPDPDPDPDPEPEPPPPPAPSSLQPPSASGTAERSAVAATASLLERVRVIVVIPSEKQAPGVR